VRDCRLSIVDGGDYATRRARRPWAIAHRIPTKARGVTLLEAVLAISLAVVLIALVYAYYRTTLHARDTLNEFNRTTLAQRRVLEMMAEDLRSTLPFSTLQTGLQGSAEEFTIPRAVLPPLSLFLSDAATPEPEVDRSLPPSNDVQLVGYDVQLVGYRLYRYEDEDGVEQIGGIERTCQRTVMAAAAEEGEDVKAVLLSERVRFLHVTYWDGEAGEEGQWVDSWSSLEPPAAVRIELGLEPLEEDVSPEEYPHPTMWRVVDIPARAIALSGGRGGGRARARGGGGGR